MQGQTRRVAQAAVFTLPGSPGIYVEDDGHLRTEQRVFRLDRVEWSQDGWGRALPRPPSPVSCHPAPSLLHTLEEQPRLVSQPASGLLLLNA